MASPRYRSRAITHLVSDGEEERVALAESNRADGGLVREGHKIETRVHIPQLGAVITGACNHARGVPIDVQRPDGTSVA